MLIKAVQQSYRSAYGVGADIHSGGFTEGIAELVEQELEGHAAFVQMDGNEMGFRPEVFDCVLANFIGWDACFDFERMEFVGNGGMMAEIFRVLKPGGQVGIGSWIEQSDLDWVTDRYRKYLPGSAHEVVCYARENPEGLKLILQEGGFCDIHVLVEQVNFALPDTGTWWRQMKQATGEWLRQVSDPEVLEMLEEFVCEELRELKGPAGILFEKTVSYAFGIKPD